MKGKVIYIYDALCGWCYGFSPVAVQLKQRFSNDFEFEVWSGGMVTGDRVGPLGQMADYIEKAYPTVEARTGIRFGEAYLNNILRNKNYISDSLPPSLALTVFKSFFPENAAEFARQIQRALYLEGKDLGKIETYGPLLAEWGIAEADFRERFEDPAYTERTRLEFKQAAELGVTGFPTMLLLHQGQFYLLAEGYRPYQEIEHILDQVANWKPECCS